MSWLSDLLASWRAKAQQKATAAATEAATKAAKASAEKALAGAAVSAEKALTGVAESFVGFAERELERARGTREPRDAPESRGSAAAPADPEPVVRRPTAKEREDKAREELERLKAQRQR